MGIGLADVRKAKIEDNKKSGGEKDAKVAGGEHIPGGESITMRGGRRQHAG